jgi:hypothetical protein
MDRRTGWTVAMLAAGLLITKSANAYIIDFTDEGLTGPSLAADTSASTIVVSTPIGNVTFSGGAILTAESNLPADTGSLYYTSYFLTGGLDPITITFPAPITNFFLDLYNGETYTETFTVADNTGVSNTVSLVPNTSSGTALISDPAVGNVVTIYTPDTSGFDFSIDNIGFDQPTPATTPEPSTWALMLVGFAVLGFAGYRHSLKRGRA